MRALKLGILSSIAIAIAFWLFSFSLEYLAVKYVDGHIWSNKTSSPMMQATEVFDVMGRRVGEFSTEQRYYVSLENIPKYVIHAFISAEDSNFYQHSGISIKGILRATWVNLRNSKFVQGGSTITQQLARLYFLTPEKRLKRKMEEVFLAIAMEKKLSKDRILELYLNKIFLGNHSYGVEAAARNYFRKSIQEVNVAEAAMIAGLPAAPSKYAPHRFFRRAKKRQVFVLERMREEGYLQPNEMKRWQKHELKVARSPLKKSKQASFYIEALRNRLVSKFSVSNLSGRGLQILTSLDQSLQNSVNRSFAPIVYKTFESVDRSLIDMALVVLDVKTGGVLAMQGGASFSKSQFNLAMHAQRPIGSAFLPIYYSLAIDRGFRLDSSLFYRGRYLSASRDGDLNLYEGMVKNRAAESARLMAWLGIGTVFQFSKSIGINFDRKDLSLALGAGSTNIISVVGAYGMLARSGRYIEPFLVDAIKTGSGDVFFQRPKAMKYGHKIIDSRSAYLINHSLSAGQKSEALSIGVNRSLHDVWTVGYNRRFVVGVWVGSKKGLKTLANSKDNLVAKSKRLWSEMKAHIDVFNGADLRFDVPEGVGYRPMRLRSEDKSYRTVQLPYRLDRM